MTNYIRLLSYENALKVIDFTRSKFKNNTAYIVSGGLGVNCSEKQLEQLKAFIKGLNVRFEIGTNHPSSIKSEIIEQLKRK